MTKNEWLSEAARIFELLHQITIENMPDDVDFTALAEAKQELLAILNGRREIPMDITLKYKGTTIHFEGKLEWIP